jgi:hypothetical protein
MSGFMLLLSLYAFRMSTGRTLHFPLFTDVLSAIYAVKYRWININTEQWCNDADMGERRLCHGSGG